jgi:aldehyde dehydrogenase (NAD+)
MDTLQQTEYKKITFLKDQYNTSGAISIEERFKILGQIEKMIQAHKKDLESALMLDLGKNSTDAFTTEILFTLHELQLMKKHLREWAKPKNVPTPLFFQPAKSYIIPEPYGVILVIAPWNYPFQLAVVPIIGAIAAGNRVVLKPSEISTHTERFLSEILPQYIDKKYLQVVCGGPHDTVALINEKPDKIFFTGSPATGKVIMMEAAKHLIPVTLELGGKSPCLVDKTADLRTSAKRIVWGKFINTGQTCIAPDYLLVDKNISKEFQRELILQIDEMYPEHSDALGKIINHRHFNRISQMLTGNLIKGGKAIEENLTIEPTLILNPQDNHPAMLEEIFGPVLPIIEYEELSEAINYIKKGEKPLALYVFSRSNANIDRITQDVSAGGICINDTLFHIVNANLPFGGVGQSGMGAYHGKFSFETFSHMKPVLHKKLWFDPNFRYPPHNRIMQKMEKLLLMLSH